MPSTLIKASPDEDFYVYWSSVVDGPLLWGTKQEFLDEFSKEITEDRFARADDKGTSALFYNLEHPVFGWDDESWIYQDEKRGGFYTIKRSDLKELCLRLENDQPIEGLMEPVTYDD